MEERTPWLSVTILCHNEEKTVERTARACSEVLRMSGWPYELVLLDDGSTDRSPAIIRRLASTLPCTRAILREDNLGIGAGVRTAFYETSGEWATWFPADLQADPARLPQLLPHLEQCDVLLTYREAGLRHGTWFRKSVSSIDRMLVRLLFGLTVRDLHWVRFYRRGVLERMRPRSNSPFLDTEMILVARRLEARIAEVPFPDQPRQGGAARGATLRNIIATVRDLVMCRVRKNG